MKTIDRLLLQAKTRMSLGICFTPFVVANALIAERVEKELDEFCNGRPHSAIIIFGEDDLIDDTDGVRIEHIPSEIV